MDYMKNLKTTSYFRDFAIMQIKLAYRIKEYLDPDPMSPSKNLSKKTSDLFLHGEFSDAVESCIKEVFIDISNFNKHELIKKEAIQFTKDLSRKYMSTYRQQQLEEKETLLARLSQIEKELALPDEDLILEEKEL